MLSLRPYQKTMVDYIVNTPRCNLYAGMGLGKTVSTLTAIDELMLLEDVTPVLVLAPQRVAQGTWPVEVKKFEHLRHLRVAVVCGTAQERKAALNQQADIYCMNYENLQWLDGELGNRWPFKMVVADECSRLKGFRTRQGTKRARSLARHVHKKASRYVGLTGTPAPNGLQDLWALLWMVDRGQRLGRSYTAFISRWFRQIQIGADRNAVKLEPFPHTEAEINERIKDVCLSLNAADYFDIQEPIVSTINVALPPKARALYEDMEQEMFMELDNGEEIEAFNPASKTVKCLQLASGAVYTDDKGAFEEIHKEKLKALESIVEEANGMPVLVAYHFKSDLARLQKHFPQGRALDKNPATIEQWNKGKIPVLFAHPASAGHGLNLQDGGNILAFFSHWWNLEEYQQICERIGPTRQAQAGHDRPVFIYHIVAQDTVDDLVMKRRDSKREVQDLLMEAMKGKEEAA